MDDYEPMPDPNRELGPDDFAPDATVPSSSSAGSSSDLTGATPQAKPSFHADEIQDEDTWDSDDALQSLTMERSVHDAESDAELTKRLLQESAPAAAMSIVHTALHGTNERTRFAAAQYVVDRNLGKPGQDPTFSTGTDPISVALAKINALAATEGNPPVPNE